MAVSPQLLTCEPGAKPGPWPVSSRLCLVAAAALSSHTVSVPLNSPQVLPEALSCPLTVLASASCTLSEPAGTEGESKLMKSFTSLKTDGHLAPYLPRIFAFWEYLGSLSQLSPSSSLSGRPLFLSSRPDQLLPPHHPSSPSPHLLPQRKLRKPHLKEDHFISGYPGGRAVVGMEERPGKEETHFVLKLKTSSHEAALKQNI